MVVTRSGKSTTAVIAKVPPEILSCIFQYFCSHCCNDYKWPFGPPAGCIEAQDTRALFNLCCVSRSFRNVAQEILFHSFDPKFPPPEAPPPWRKYWKRRLEPFLQTVAARPDLARSVKAVFLSRALCAALDLDYSRNAFQACVRALGRSPLGIFRKDANSIKRACLLSPLSPSEVGDGDRLRAYTPPRSEDFCAELFSVLVAILPNLTHLAVSKQSSSRVQPVLWDILPDILDSLGVEDIPTIKTIETHEPPQKLLRRCTKLETCITDGRHDFPDMPTVKHLHLRHTERDPRVDYSKCINACSGSLITLSCVNATDSFYEAIDIPRLHDSLEVLHLNSEYIVPLPSLKMFEKLKYLFLDAHGIYGMYDGSQSPPFHESLAEVLPRNIVNLSVRTCVHTQFCWQRDLYDALTSEEDWFPELQSVTSNKEISHEHLAEVFDRLGLEWVCKKPTRYYMNSSYYSS